MREMFKQIVVILDHRHKISIDDDFAKNSLARDNRIDLTREQID